jgi:prefoldin subunit 5
VVNPPPPLPYQTQTVEQIINTFSSALEEDALEFLHEAQRVAHYDAVLRDSQRSISYLASQVSRLFLRQSDLDKSLATLESYQQTLSCTLDGLEIQLEEMLANQSDLTPDDADIQRETAYAMALECNSRLQTMEDRVDGIRKDLKEAQEKAWKKSGSTGDQDVAKIVDWMNQQHDMLSELEVVTRNLEGDLRVMGREWNGS